MKFIREDTTINSIQKLAKSKADEESYDDVMLDTFTRAALTAFNREFNLMIPTFHPSDKDEPFWVVFDITQTFPDPLDKKPYWTKEEWGWYEEAASLNRTILSNYISSYICYLIKLNDDDEQRANDWKIDFDNTARQIRELLQFIDEKYKVPTLFSEDGKSAVNPNFVVMDTTNSFGSTKKRINHRTSGNNVVSKKNYYWKVHK